MTSDPEWGVPQMLEVIAWFVVIAVVVLAASFVLGLFLGAMIRVSRGRPARANVMEPAKRRAA
jgi:hypothetical protein